MLRLSNYRIEKDLCQMNMMLLLSVPAQRAMLQLFGARSWASKLLV